MSPSLPPAHPCRTLSALQPTGSPVKQPLVAEATAVPWAPDGEELIGAAKGAGNNNYTRPSGQNVG